MSAFFEGTVHAHSSNSYDARMSYAELRAFFMGKGLHFVCMTEHIEHLAQADIDRIIDGCRAHSDERFLFVPGIEMDCFVIYFLGVDHVTVDFTSNRSIFDSLKRTAKMCVFAHPIKAKYDYPTWLMELCDGVEVLNTKHDGQHYLRPQSEALYRRVLARRPRAVALAGMDFHGVKNYTPVRMRLSRTGPLTEDLVLDCLRQGRFEIVKDGVPFSAYGPLRRNLARLRIHAMDLSHRVHKGLAGRGIAVPKGIKRTLRRLMEGG